MSTQTELIEALSKENPIVEAFLTIGLTSEDLRLHLLNNAEVSPLVLSKFPPNYKVPETLPTFCFPWGMKLIKGPQETLSETFNFIIYEETGQTLYCAALIIYEAAGSAKSQASIFRTETRDIIDVNLLKNSQEDYSLLKSSNLDFTSRRSRSAVKKNRSRKTKDAEVGQDFQYFSTGQVMVPKCLVLVSRHPFFETLKKILMGIYKLTRTKLEIPIECYICHLFLRVPLPPKGFVEIIYQLQTSIIVIKIPPTNQLPLFDCNLTYLFSALPVNIVLSVFLSLLLEENVIFLSASTDKLCAVSYSFLSLMYPFKWPFSYVPVLPYQMIDQLYSSVKFVYGIHSSFKEEVIIRSPADVCIVDLDEGVIEDRNEIVNIRETKEANEFVYLPDHYSKKLAKQLMDITEDLRFKQIKKLAQFQCEDIRNSFFQFFVSIFVDFKEFLIHDKSDISNYTTLFNSSGFLSRQKTDRDFFRRFLSTQIFSNFCERNTKTSNMDQYTENLFFTEHTISKKNRCLFKVHKKQTLFINDTSHKIREKLKIPLPENCFQKKSYFFYYTFPELNYEILAEFGLPKKNVNKINEIIFPKTEAFETFSTLKGFNRQAESLYGIWLQLWTSTLWAQEEIERNERVQELVMVLEKMIKNGEKPNFCSYSRLVEGCLEVDPEIALAVFAFMDSKRVLINTQFQLLLNKVLNKLFTRNKCVSLQAVSNPATEEIALGFFNQKQRKRTFSKKFQPNSHNINIVLAQSCQICSKISSISEEYLKNFCCKLLMTNILQISHIPSKVSETVHYISVPLLINSFNHYLQSGQNFNTVNLEDLREHTELFWNLVWHFKSAGIGFRLFVPYERENERREIKIFVASEGGTQDEIVFDWVIDKDCQTNEEVKRILRCSY